jgi:LytS/YehU family sensor histidine kinase
MDYPTIDLAADSRPFQRQATRASVIAVMTAACIVSNYLLIGVFNVKLMDLIVFSSGFLFGPMVGASVGILTWLVYGTLNPYGFSLPVLVATSLMESLYGVAGGFLGTNRNEWMGAGLTANLKYGIVGFLLTFIYDLVTNSR